MFCQQVHASRVGSELSLVLLHLTFSTMHGNSQKGLLASKHIVHEPFVFNIYLLHFSHWFLCLLLFYLSLLSKTFRMDVDVSENTVMTVTVVTVCIKEVFPNQAFSALTFLYFLVLLFLGSGYPLHILDLSFPCLPISLKKLPSFSRW